MVFGGSHGRPGQRLHAAGVFCPFVTHREAGGGPVTRARGKTVACLAAPGVESPRGKPQVQLFA